MWRIRDRVAWWNGRDQRDTCRRAPRLEPLEERRLLAAQPIISEFLASNRDTLTDGFGETPDWVELYNAGDARADLTGWHLTDNPDRLAKWTFPATSLDPGAFLVVFASGRGTTDPAGNLHTNFRIDADGEYLGLVRPGGQVVVSEFGSSGTPFPKQEPDISYGVVQGTELNVPRFFDPPSPGSPNAVGVAGLVGDTRFSVDRGFYASPFQVEITTATPEASIYFTVDGSEPVAENAAATLYTTPVRIATTTTLRAAAYRDNYVPSNVDTQTYVFLEDVLRQDPQAVSSSVVYPSTWQAGARADYAMDPEVVARWDDQSPANTDFGIREALQSLPTMSLVLDHNDLWGRSSGIYTNSTSRGDAWRKPGSVEYFDPLTGDEFQYDVGIQIHGGASRDNVRLKKHSFRLIFSDEFGGPTRLTFPLFDGSAFDDINTVVMRASFTDSFATRTITGRYSPLDSQYLRDVWMRDTQLAMGHLSADSTYVHLYINGLYWGLYSPAERPDDAFLALHLGGEPEDWDVVKDFNELFKGDKAAWNQMFALADQLPSAAHPDDIYFRLQGLNSDGTPDPRLPAYLDMENFIDYMILHLYAGAEDWPHHNWYAGRNRENPGDGFKFFVWDQEIVLDGRFRDRTNVGRAGNHQFTPAELYDKLRHSDEFLLKFADRAALHLLHDGALTTAANQARWTERANQIEAAIIAESARWGDAREGEQVVVDQGLPLQTIPTMTVDHWRHARGLVMDRYFPISLTRTLERFRARGLLPAVDPPEFQVEGVAQHGGEVPLGAAIELAAPGGLIYYTTGGRDPRVAGGAVSPVATPYTGQSLLLPLGETTVQTRVLKDGVWSALAAATFQVVAPDDTNLRADFDQDGTVDGNDFLAWQLGFGIGSGAAPADGDADRDGDVDGDDFLSWQVEFGSQAGGGGGHARASSHQIAPRRDETVRHKLRSSWMHSEEDAKRNAFARDLLFAALREGAFAKRLWL